MNAAYASLHPLPAALSRRESDRNGRRHRIGTFEIAEEALALFNALLARLDRHHARIDRDQLATAARDLADSAAGSRAPPCIHERMRRAGAIDMMLTDAGWTPEDEVVGPAGLVVDYVRGEGDLIPDRLPKVGRLDDAIVIDVAWPALAPEIRNYLDFCRVRQIEAGLGGDGYRFGRTEWRQAREAETQWIEHCRRVGGDSYLTQPPAHFRVC